MYQPSSTITHPSGELCTKYNPIPCVVYEPGTLTIPGEVIAHHQSDYFVRFEVNIANKIHVIKPPKWVSFEHLTLTPDSDLEEV